MLTALAGLLLPSVTITILMSAAYAHVSHTAGVRAALRGILPATIGLGMVTAFQTARPLITGAWQEGWDTLAVSLLALVGSGAAIGLWRLPVVYVLLASGGLCAAHAWLRSRFVPPAARQP